MSDVPPPSAQPPAVPPAVPPWGSPRGPGPEVGPTHAPTGVASLIFAVLGMTVLPVIGSVVALVLGYQSRTAARNEPDRYHDQLGQIGRILGWVGLVLTLGMLLLAALAFVVFLGGWFFTVG